MFKNDGPKVLKFLYEPAVDGGVAGSSYNVGVLPDGFIPQRIDVNTIAAMLASGGAATVSVGYTGATTAYLNAETKASFDGEHDVKSVAITSLKGFDTNTRNVLVTPGTNDFQSGKLEIYITGFVPVHDLTVSPAHD